jgi:hypothetical protein
MEAGTAAEVVADFTAEEAVASTEVSVEEASTAEVITAVEATAAVMGVADTVAVITGADTAATVAPPATGAEGRSEACAVAMGTVLLRRVLGRGRAVLPLVVMPRRDGTDLRAAAGTQGCLEDQPLGTEAEEQPGAIWLPAIWLLVTRLPTDNGTRLALTTPKALA